MKLQILIYLFQFAQTSNSRHFEFLKQRQLTGDELCKKWLSSSPVFKKVKAINTKDHNNQFNRIVHKSKNDLNIQDIDKLIKTNEMIQNLNEEIEKQNKNVREINEANKRLNQKIHDTNKRIEESNKILCGELSLKPIDTIKTNSYGMLHEMQLITNDSVISYEAKCKNVAVKDLLNSIINNKKTFLQELSSCIQTIREKNYEKHKRICMIEESIELRSIYFDDLTCISKDYTEICRQLDTIEKKFENIKRGNRDYKELDVNWIRKMELKVAKWKQINESLTPRKLMKKSTFEKTVNKEFNITSLERESVQLNEGRISYAKYCMTNIVERVWLSKASTHSLKATQNAVENYEIEDK